MNGRRKYKVTIRVYDHPPGTSESLHDQHCVERNEQKIDAAISKDNTISSGIKSVNESSTSVSGSDDRSHSSVRDSCGNPSPKSSGFLITRTNSRGHDRGLKTEGMLNSESSECTKPANKPTSLNINKLTRNNAIDQEELQGANLTGSNIVNCVRTKPCKFIATDRQSLHGWSVVDFEAKFGIRKPRNGFSSHLPIVVLNSANMEEASYDENILTNNGVDDNFWPGFDEFGRRTDRPPLNREGSACSSDSIITEIEGLTDDESELKSCSNDDGDTAESAPKINNWKKLKGVMHLTQIAKMCKKKVPWVQLAGHQGNFKAGEQGTILKKTNDIEKECLIKLMKDVLRPYVPEFKREVFKNDESYLVLQDLLFGFESPSVMDCKMGVRTFLEDELEQARKKPVLRKDLYQKMVDIDPNAPTEDERKAGGISKPRYMKWREELSSSASLGFRIEGIKVANGKPNKDFKTTRSKADVCEKFRNFINRDNNVKGKYLQRLKAIRGVLESSPLFRTHEVIGSSLLFVHDSQGNVNVWMIDFAKTIKVEGTSDLTHRAAWQEGNHEDGYLFGLDNMISIWSDV